MDLIIKVANQSTRKKKRKKLTIADFVDVLKSVESEQGKDAARFFASRLDYSAINQLAMDFVSGTDTNLKNDPQQMPTRFMILFGADDSKLQQIDDHPDKFKDDHKMNVANLRKGLKLLGYDVKDSGPNDKEVYIAFMQYLARQTTNITGVYDSDQPAENREFADVTFSLDIDPNDTDVQKDTFSMYSSEAVPKYKQVKTVKNGDANLPTFENKKYGEWQ